MNDKDYNKIGFIISVLALLVYTIHILIDTEEIIKYFKEKEKNEIQESNKIKKNEVISKYVKEDNSNKYERFFAIEDSLIGGLGFEIFNNKSLKIRKQNDGFSVVTIDSGTRYYNLMNKNGAVVLKNWTTNIIDDFSGGYAKITKEDANYNRTYNFFTTDGEYLFDEWLNYHGVYDFSEGYAFISDNNTRSCNLINPEGELQIDWIEGCFGAVQKFKNGTEELYMYNKEGERIYNFIFSDSLDFFFKKHSIYQIEGNNQTVYDFNKGYLRVMKYNNGRFYNMMNRDGELLYEWTKEKPEY